MAELQVLETLTEGIELHCKQRTCGTLLQMYFRCKAAKACEISLEDKCMEDAEYKEELDGFRHTQRFAHRLSEEGSCGNCI